MLHVDDERRIDEYQSLVRSAHPPELNQLSQTQQRLARMLVANIGSQVIGTSSVQTALDMLWAHPRSSSNWISFWTCSERV